MVKMLCRERLFLGNYFVMYINFYLRWLLNKSIVLYLYGDFFFFFKIYEIYSSIYIVFFSYFDKWIKIELKCIINNEVGRNGGVVSFKAEGKKLRDYE